MELIPLTAISPIDGRYREQIKELQPIFSEFGLMRFRLEVEVKWLQMLITHPKITALAKPSKMTCNFLDKIVKTFSEDDAKQIKVIEKNINHDTKSIEYFLKEKIATNNELEKVKEFIHFGCTSDDIGNVAYGLMLKTARNQCLLPAMNSIIEVLTKLAHRYAAQPMLAKTHGQPASPTTLGKELANFVVRLQRQYKHLLNVPIMGKFNGTVGNYNAHLVAFPDVNWTAMSKELVKSFCLEWNEYTTQIEPHDYMAELFDNIARFNTILLGFTRDMWGYVSLGYFKQKAVVTEVGSSVMPHKINPIDFENAEGNLGLANALLHHFSTKLPISRWQRDLSDSTVLRNIGMAFAYSLIAYKSILRGLSKVTVNAERLSEDLEHNWEVLAEAIQTVMRCYQLPEPYEQLKKFTRGKKIDQATLHAFVDNLDLPIKVKKSLKRLTPAMYIGDAAKLAKII
jgi:adenylosuccinate lyase